MRVDISTSFDSSRPKDPVRRWQPVGIVLLLYWHPGVLRRDSGKIYEGYPGASCRFFPVSCGRTTVFLPFPLPNTISITAPLVNKLPWNDIFSVMFKIQYQIMKFRRGIFDMTDFWIPGWSGFAVSAGKQHSAGSGKPLFQGYGHWWSDGIRRFSLTCAPATGDCSSTTPRFGRIVIQESVTTTVKWACRATVLPPLSNR